MILYRLSCSGDHVFEAWFKNSAAYDEQAASGAITCPDCGDAAVRKAPMAPRIARGRGAEAAAAREAMAEEAATVAEGEGAQAPAAAAATPARTYTHARSAEMRRALAELRKQVEETCDYVGPEFAEEARKIHYGEVDGHSIYGEATDDEAEALAEEGIKIGKIPWLPRTDS